MRRLNVAWISISTSLFLLTLLSATAGAQCLPGDTSSFAAAGKEADARIARGGNGCLLVRSDTRTVLARLFLCTSYPYDGDGLGTMTDLAARGAPDSTVLDDPPVVLNTANTSGSPFTPWSPKVAAAPRVIASDLAQDSRKKPIGA